METCSNCLTSLKTHRPSIKTTLIDKRMRGGCSGIVTLLSCGLSPQMCSIPSDRLRVIYASLLRRHAGISGSISCKCRPVGFDSRTVYVVVWQPPRLGLTFTMMHLMHSMKTFFRKIDDGSSCSGGISELRRHDVLSTGCGSEVFILSRLYIHYPRLVRWFQALPVAGVDIEALTVVGIKINIHSHSGINRY